MEFRVLGPVEASVDGRPVDLGHPKQRAVAAVLLCEPNRALPAEQLIDRVWGEDPPGSVRNVLYGYIGRLRRALRAAGGGPAVGLTRRSGGYQLDTDPERVDLHRFQRLVARARGGDGDPVDLLRDALDLWSGEALAGLSGAWAEGTRARLAEERLTARLELYEAELRRGRDRELLAELRALTEEHPLDERAVRQLMTALYRSERQAESLDAYEATRVRLADELGVDPGPELRGLYERILRNDPELMAPPASADPVPEPVVDARAADGAAAVAPGVPAGLPHTVGGFRGREGELARLDTRLPHGTSDASGACGGPGAVTITAIIGTAGVGKTALAVHWAHRTRHRFPDGQLYVDLRGFDHDCEPLRPAEAIAQLLHGLGVPRERIPADQDRQAHHYRSLLDGRRMLIVLDNAVSAEQVRPLLPGSPTCQVLVTSRQRLSGLVARDGAHPLVLGSLAPEEARAVLAAAVGERRTAAEPAAAGRLTERCGALPLALRVAAAQLVCEPGRSIADLADELADGNRLGALELDDDPATAVRRAFTLSYRALADGPRRLFRLLGLAPGPEITAPAAAALLDSTVREAERLLRALDAAHLIESPRPGRHRPHDLLREYAAERAVEEIGAAERTAALERLLAFWLRHTEAATAYGYTPPVRLPRDRADAGLFDGREAALGWLEDERANLVAAVVRGAETGPYRTAWQLADDLRTYFYQRRHLSSWETAAEAGLRAARRAADPLGEAAMAQSLATLYRHTGEVGRSLEHHRAALHGYRAAGFAEGEAAMLCNLGTFYDDLGDIRRAGAWQDHGIALFRAIGRTEVIGPALTNSSGVYVQLGELRRAVDRANEAIEVQAGHANPSGTVGPLINRGLAHLAFGELDRALADASEALRICEELRQRHHLSTAHDLLALVHRDAGRPEAAFGHAERALELAVETGTVKDETDSLTTLGELHRRAGRAERAEARLTRSLETSAAHGLRRQQAEAHLGLAHVRHGARAYDAAAGHALRALDLARDQGLRLVECRAHHTLAAVCRRLGRSTRARRHADSARRIHAATGYHPTAGAWPVS
ncbi:tetratricopeptide repeat protein [Streptomyces sp. NA02950]|uniref:AfsR/SARP family transcriptional regulator n=1 Tax=Streptomyces sp. NA02950 TaxID=2742137 RepID=UPI001590419E|nr:BTAD domain-containing putative transcriptional regulator [Streptomyces sp. NA02950]QKV92924.1 tetratricopeptide repeat protein [Streptomyces sp. NA02950]